MERIVRIEEAVNKNEDLRKTITIIQDAETRIKQAVFHSYLTHDSVEAIIFRIIETTVGSLPDTVDQEKYREDLKRNANHWMMVAKYTSQALETMKVSKPKIVTPLNINGTIDEEAYKDISVMFEKGYSQHEDYNQKVLRMTKELAKTMANQPFKSSTVDYHGLTMRTNLSIRASAERQIRDQIHREENENIINANDFVWISSHADSSERCEKWQGRLYSTKGKKGTLEGHSYVPLEEATNSNWITTKSGKRWNNSILAGFNCRHYPIPYVPGTVPVIEYDKEIVERERTVTANIRKMERDIITGKTLHKLLVEAERDNRLNLSKDQIGYLKREVRARYGLMVQQYQKYCEDHGRAYNPWRTSILVDRSKEAENYTDLNVNNTVELNIREDDKITLKRVLVNKKELENVTISKYNQATSIESILTKDIVSAGKEVGAEIPGLEHRLKSKDSLMRKIENEYAEAIAKGIKITLNEITENIKDANRYTAVLDPNTFVEDYNSMNKKLLENGYKIHKIKNTFKLDGATYKGINNNYVAPNGTIFELQFHTLESFNLKNGKLHDLYEKERDVNTSVAEREDLIKQMKKLTSRLTIPKNIDSI